MALGLYKLSDGQGAISSDGSFSNPVLWEASSTGGTLEGKFYLRMEDANTEYLTDGVISAVDSAGEDESGWFSFALDEGGGPGEYASSIEFEIPLGSEVPIWIKVVLPEGLEAEPKDDVRISASYIGHTTED